MTINDIHFGDLMSKILLALCAICLSTSALAGARCSKHPKNEWLSEADAKSRIEAQGYVIKKFKVDGDCYEIYGTTKDGKKAEIYYDTKTLEVVKSEIEK